MMQPQQYTLPDGTPLHGRYRIEHTISQGGFGNVYLARDTKFNRDVAIKEAYLSDEETRKQFTLEAEVLIHTDHVGVVRGFEEFEANGRFYLVMAFIAGQNMEDMQIAHFKAYQRPLPENVVLPMMALICAATQALHDGKILHRDIKPANIKVDGTGQPILLDLGLAKLYHDPASVTLIAARAYTPGYAPPEQCEDGGSTSEVTDVYALGATTYYALTGRQPWDAVRRLTEFAQAHPDMPNPRHWLPEISPATDELVMQALALDPAKRFPSARALGRAIEAAYSGLAAKTLCPNCHFLNASDADYCGSCGIALRQHGAQGSEQAVIKAAVAPVVHPEAVHMNPAPQHPP
ncbi:MAG: protein kinase, partial [Ktedonobacterales bacterium]|nr:protein kinase [Ktedonobacterales bacterium]